MREVTHWKGRGWYAARQEGAHEGQCIVAYRLDVSEDDHAASTWTQAVNEEARAAGLGTPYYLHEEPQNEL